MSLIPGSQQRSTTGLVVTAVFLCRFFWYRGADLRSVVGEDACADFRSYHVSGNGRRRRVHGRHGDRRVALSQSPA